MTSQREQRRVFLTGGTGYLGSRLIPILAERGHLVRALVREGSQQKLPAGCEVVVGDALRKETFAEAVKGTDTFVQLVGVAHPSPAKAKEFRGIDLVSVRASVAAAAEGAVKHFVYVSVAHPAPAMKDYIAVRMEGEQLIRDSGMTATILRPWYVLGPGHRWPYFLIPMYWLAERVPAWKEGALRLGLMTVAQMLRALADAVDSAPAERLRVWDVPEIRRH